LVSLLHWVTFGYLIASVRQKQMIWLVCCDMLTGKWLKKRSVELVCQVYSQVYTALTAAGSGYSDIPTIAPRTPDQVVKLLC